MSELQKFISKQTAKLSNISSRKIYGLDSFYLRDKAFIVISADEKIVIKVDDFEVRDTLQKKYQATQWLLNDKVMENWFALPETFNKKKSKLTPVLEMTSRALLNPKKEKKKHSKKSKVQKKAPKVEKAIQVETSPSIFKKLFKFLS